MVIWIAKNMIVSSCVKKLSDVRFSLAHAYYI